MFENSKILKRTHKIVLLHIQTLKNRSGSEMRYTRVLSFIGFIRIPLKQETRVGERIVRETAEGRRGWNRKNEKIWRRKKKGNICLPRNLNKKENGPIKSSRRENTICTSFSSTVHVFLWAIWTDLIVDGIWKLKA